MFQKTAIRAESVEVGENRTLPKLFKPGSGMKRFVTAPDLSYRAGYTRVGQGQEFTTFFWYDEFWVVIEGNARVVAVDRPTGTTTTEELQQHDYVFIGAGTDITVENTGGGPLLFMYIAIPASNKYSSWMAYLTPEDIASIRVREEHTKVLLEAEAQRG
jgi:mannose-6-phosphate isomerase-like protein (cupin superfamily)